MEVYNHIIIKRSDGVPVNLHYEPVQKLRRAARFNAIEDYERFITGYYKPPDAALYKPQLIRITYEELDANAKTY
jgi:hypothetical protein